MTLVCFYELKNEKKAKTNYYYEFEFLMKNWPKVIVQYLSSSSNYPAIFCYFTLFQVTLRWRILNDKL